MFFKYNNFHLNRGIQIENANKGNPLISLYFSSINLNKIIFQEITAYNSVLFQIAEILSISNFTDILFENCEINIFFNVFLVERINFYKFQCFNCFGNFFHVKFSNFVSITNNHFVKSLVNFNLINDEVFSKASQVLNE